LSLPENRVGFNFILKQSNTGVLFLGSQLDTCFYVVYKDKEGKIVYKTIPLGTQPLCGVLANKDSVLMIGAINETLIYFKIDNENSLTPKAEGKFKMSD
jgi:hypothetical protein